MAFHYCNSQNIPIELKERLQSYKSNLRNFLKGVPTFPLTHQVSPTYHNDFPIFSSA